jgi:hypothetical protein
MQTIYTQQGKRVEILWEHELWHPIARGAHVRAYCPIHGGDHQRSLSIQKTTGWGHCFNATCEATVLVAEWNRALAERLLRSSEPGTTFATPLFVQSPALLSKPRPSFVRPGLLWQPDEPPAWQADERSMLCALDGPMRRSLASSQWAQMYLRERCIPLKIALAAGVGYLPAALLQRPELRTQRALLSRWVNRLLFPLHSPDGKGYIGRSLWQWRPGMNETIHKSLLEQTGGPKRWLKTSPAGWFSTDFAQFSRTIILVEGAFDRLTLLAAGLPAQDIVALAGTTLPVEWLPARVKTVVLALDGDAGGKAASQRLAGQIEQAGLRVENCSLTQESCGKDWNEHWRLGGRRSLTSVFGAFSESWSA